MNSSTASASGTAGRRLRPRRGKTFSGCGTCRSRHLKCDEARPICRRCIDAKQECSGYPGYRADVLWRPVKSPSHFRGRTRHANTTSRDTPQSTSQDVLQTSHRGPFHTLASPALDSRTPVIADPREGEHLFQAPVPVFPPARIRPSLPSRSENPHSTPDREYRHLDRFDQWHLQRQMIEHWINHLSDALVPIPGPYNPLKGIFVPIAYAGARDLALHSSAPVALFYLICASSAFHLSANSADNRKSAEFMTLALSHHNEGIRHLQNSLNQDDPSQRESVLASLLMCLMYEPATVEPSFWRNHLRGASQWLRKIDGKALIRTEPAAILYQMFAGTAILLRSQMISSQAALEDCIGFDSELFSGPYHLHRVFGLPKQLLEAVSRIIETAASLRQHPDEAYTLPSDILDKQEFELYLSVPEYPRTLTPPIEVDLIYHHSWIFYFASIIYFKRTLRNTPANEVQLLIEQAFDHIEALEACTSRPSSPLTWPIAVIFFEVQKTQLRKRAMDWIEFIIKSSTLSIWQRAKPLFPAFWDRRQEAGCEDMHWDVFMDDPSIQGIMMF